MLQFTDPATALLYAAISDIDQEIEVPVIDKTCSCKAYKGMLSGIDPMAAQRYINMGGNLIVLKATNPDASSSDEA